MKITDKDQLQMNDRVELRKGKENVTGTIENVGVDADSAMRDRRRVSAVWLRGRSEAFEFRTFGGWTLVSADR